MSSNVSFRLRELQCITCDNRAVAPLDLCAECAERDAQQALALVEAELRWLRTVVDAVGEQFDPATLARIEALTSGGLDTAAVRAELHQIGARS